MTQSCDVMPTGLCKRRTPLTICPFTPSFELFSLKRRKEDRRYTPILSIFIQMVSLNVFRESMFRYDFRNRLIHRTQIQFQAFFEV